MALFECKYPSTIMNKFMAMNVILPDDQDKTLDKDGKYPVIFLLHGYTDDYTKWMRMTSIERYATEKGIAIVMPDGGKSFYTDMAHGDPYFTYITEEVVDHVRQWFPITTDPEYTFIAGLSMGGYGAMKIGLTYPNRFKGIGCFSGALAMAQTANIKYPEDAEDWLKRLETDLPLVFEDVNELVDGPHDVFWLAQTKARDSLPNIYISCGTDDFIYSSSVAFCELLSGLNIDYHYNEEPADHSWGFWDREIVRYIDWVRTLIDS